MPRSRSTKKNSAIWLLPCARPNKLIGNASYELSDKVLNSRKLARSLFVVSDIKAGEIFTEENIRSIRPGQGLPPKWLNEVLGRKAKVDIQQGTPLCMEHFAGIDKPGRI